MSRMSADQILQGFRALAHELARRGERAELLIMGGAVMVLIHKSREATKDVDAMVMRGSSEQVKSSVGEVADRLALPPDWLNDGAKGFLEGIAIGETVFAEASLIVHAIADHQMLAMKLSAWRDRIDGQDAATLLARLRGTREEVWKLVEPHLVPGRQQKARYAYDDTWEQVHGTL